ncbi:MAG: amino acid permease [Patescibacteria group bacterium]
MTQQKKHALSVFSLMMMNIALIASLRGLPTMAEEGLSIVFFLLFAAVVFLIPVALVSAELATAWPKEGGIYVWIKEAFGERWGFAIVWMEWLQNMVFYPTALSATAGILAYGFSPTLAENPLYILVVVISVYWGATFINLKGLKWSSLFTNIGVFAGLVIPGAVLIASGFYWVLGGHSLAIPITFQNFMPNLSNMDNLVFLTGVFLFFAGMEVSAVHAQEVKNPKKDYPKAILMSSIVIVALFILGALTIALIIPRAEISLTAGIMEVFAEIFGDLGMKWIVPILGFLVSIGLVASIIAWIAGPSKGVLVAAKHGDLPPLFRKTNKNHMQTTVLIIQGIVVSCISLIFLFMPDVSSSFWILTALAAQLYLSVYIIMFIAAIALKYKKPDVERPYSVPGGKIGMIIIAGIGLSASLFAIILGFLPPSQLPTGSLFFYEAFLVIGLFGVIVVPHIIYKFRKESWKHPDLRK